MNGLVGRLQKKWTYMLAGYVVDGGFVIVISKESTREISVLCCSSVVSSGTPGGEMTRGVTVAAVAEDTSLPSALASAIPMTEIR